MHVVQIVPQLNEGGVERGTVELSRELVRHGCGSTVISAGGKLVPQNRVRRRAARDARCCRQESVDGARAGLGAPAGVA